LDDGDPPGLLDRQQTGGSIAEVPREDDSHDPWAIAPGGTAEKWIDGGARVVFLGVASQPNVAGMKDEMVIGLGDVNATWFDRFSVHCMPCGKRTGATEDLRQDTSD
jgi:hypothetical protein